MAGGKRASMREGPLAALFRRTDEDAPPEQAERVEQPAQRSEPTAQEPAREREQRLDYQQASLPSAKERLSAAFSQDIPHNVMERSGEPSREYRPRDEPRISRTQVHKPVLRVA